jgi:hypothetical protein
VQCGISIRPPSVEGLGCSLIPGLGSSSLLIILAGSRVLSAVDTVIAVKMIFGSA